MPRSMQIQGQNPFSAHKYHGNEAPLGNHYALNTSVSNTDYMEVSSTTMPGDTPLSRTDASGRPNRLSGIIHCHGKTEPKRRKVAFVDESSSERKHVYDANYVPLHNADVTLDKPEIDLESNQARDLPATKEAVSIDAEHEHEYEPLSRLQIVVCLGFDAYLCRKGAATKDLRHFWIYEDITVGHMLLWADCERVRLRGAIPLRDMEQIAMGGDAEMVITTKYETLAIKFFNVRECDFWASKITLLHNLS